MKVKVFVGNIFEIEKDINQFLDNDDVEFLDLKVGGLFTGNNIDYTYTLIYKEITHCDNCSYYFKKSNACTAFNSNVYEDLIKRCKEEGAKIYE